MRGYFTPSARGSQLTYEFIKKFQFISRPARNSPEEDEGFIDEVAEPKKSVQFNSNPEILAETPASQDDNDIKVDKEKSEEMLELHELGAKRHKTVLPPLDGSPNNKPPRKTPKNKQRHKREAAVAGSPSIGSPSSVQKMEK